MKKATATTQTSVFDPSETTLISFDYNKTVDYLRDMTSKLEGIEDYSNDMLDSIEWTHEAVAELDMPEITRAELANTFHTVRNRMIELHNTANAGAHWFSELLNQLDRLPIAE